MSILDFFKKKPVRLEPAVDPLAQLALNAAAKQRELCNLGCATDEIPSGVGRFGYDITNPIPVHLPAGRQEYLKRLRFNSGESIQFNRVGSTFASSAKEQQDMVDIVEILDLKGTRVATLYFSVYHQRTSQKAPEGFRF